MLTLNLHQAKELVSLFGDCDDTLVTIQECSEGHSGPGIYAYFDEYPEEGSAILRMEPYKACGNCCNWQHTDDDEWGTKGFCEKKEEVRYSHYNDCQDHKPEPV